MDTTWADQAILSDDEVATHLPEELRSLLQSAGSATYLDGLATAALHPTLTTAILVYYEPLFPDLCARWMLSRNGSGTQAVRILSAFARVLPFAPYLAIYAEHLVSHRGPPNTLEHEGHSASSIPLPHYGFDPGGDQDANLLDFLLTMFRLLQFDHSVYAQLVSPLTLQTHFGHANPEIRYLSIRVFCLYLHASDALTLELTNQYVGGAEVRGEWESIIINYRFLTLWEEKLYDDIHRKLKKARLSRASSGVAESRRLICRDDLSPWTAEICGVLLPRLCHPLKRSSALIPTPTTIRNARLLAEALKSLEPILITGLSGAGKTALVTDVARELGADKSMLTLHLNDQTDAKVLIGMYTTGTIPGTFRWRAGPLLTAVREGHWVLIEDLDRAPTEVLAVIMPLLSDRALTVPSQGETVRAGACFKLIATMRTTLTRRGEEAMPATAMFGSHLWRRVNIETPSIDEYGGIIASLFPILQAYVPTILRVFARVQGLYNDQTFLAKHRILPGKSVNPRDLLRWCRRLVHVFESAGPQTGLPALPESANMDMFVEAVDCFVESQQNDIARWIIAQAIGEEMHVSPQQVEYLSSGYAPSYVDTSHSVRIGRVRLPKHRAAAGLNESSHRKYTRPFVTTKQSLRLLQRIGVAVRESEPVLLVGETGTGKTALVQRFAHSLGCKLTVLNLSQQSESGDLLGGFKPVNIKTMVIPMKENFDSLFESTFSVGRNKHYLEMLGKCVLKENWIRVMRLWREALKMVAEALGSQSSASHISSLHETDHQPKRRKMGRREQDSLRARWDHFRKDVDSLEVLLSGGGKTFAFKFMEGSIVRAARNGEWVLLDEINLAPAETLESLAGLFSDGSSRSGSILLSDAGEAEQVQAHPDFRIFGAMNPATDVGKRDLPFGIRSRFCEIYVESQDKDLDDLLQIVKAWLGDLHYKDDRMALELSRLYLETNKLVSEGRLVDAANQRPHFSLRTLTRTLSYIADIAPMYGTRRAMYEGFSMSFLTFLDKESEKLLVPLMNKYVFGNQRNLNALMQQKPRMPESAGRYVQFESYWIRKGSFPIQAQPEYVITPSVRNNLLNLIRAVSTSRFPVLLQGPTSSGKTSLLAYLAKLTGNKFVRINNHEHTDLQEYLGTYVSDNTGQLRFQEGVLVQALREGHWIVLDELNLAPTDVLEALNRLLDDNRELMIPETQEVVRPHPDFMLLATQNPPGLYGGRKILSRAFRNRFIELHFNEIPENELERILQERTQIAPSHCAKIIAVYKELSLLRQTDRLFEQRNSFMTLRDIFRWGQRPAGDQEQLACNGFMLVAERIRKPEEKRAVKEIIERVFKLKINEEKLYNDLNVPKFLQTHANTLVQGIIWTKSMRRLYSLASRAVTNNEPVLLVGETGCGKTSLCQFLAEAFGNSLNIVNAHQSTEAGDLIGAQRPLRNRSKFEQQLIQDLKTIFGRYVHCQVSVEGDVDTLLEAFGKLERDQLEKIPRTLLEQMRRNALKHKTLFEWKDGALVRAMKSGEFFLLDEISLADDSVLERLNSLLEPERTILLAEKGPNDSTILAAPGFQFLATMNPGGDFGKRELSPALRNRFTEIWVPPLSDEEDLLQLVQAKLRSPMKQYATIIVHFAQWFVDNFNTSPTSVVSIRDILAWVDFLNSSRTEDPYYSLLHGAALVFIDTLGANPAAMVAILPDEIARERRRCLGYLTELLEFDMHAIYSEHVDISYSAEELMIGRFSIAKFGLQIEDIDFKLHAPTTKVNAMRILRGMQLRKPILLEGSPGVGKTTLVLALAQATGNALTRINLSEQTDLVDLFGSDVPVEGAGAGNFVWREGPFLQAMQRGDWVLLDEMNLASQSVLEGLNSCFDHRGEVYISELDCSFVRHPHFTVFATQNPHHQGGGRKGLPSSFVNRFSVVFADELSFEDLMLVCKETFPTYSTLELHSLLAFITTLDKETRKQGFGSQGGPWEFNLRDVTRWLQLLTSRSHLYSAGTAADYLDLVVSQRFRSHSDKEKANLLFKKTHSSTKKARHVFHNISPKFYQAGLGLLKRDGNGQSVPVSAPSHLNSRVAVLESLSICVQKRWPCILVGPSGSGKARLIKYLASTTGAKVTEFTLNSEVDAMDLIGSYEQTDSQRQARLYLTDLEAFIRRIILNHARSSFVPQEAFAIMTLLKSSTAYRDHFVFIREYLMALRKTWPSLELSSYLQRCEDLVNQRVHTDIASFEWVDGVLVKALQQGVWLVLRNANLCSSSVLDRLNSLLEPNGQLLITERSNSCGETLLRPHPDFRIFLTMDPRHGELSRAMRNRSVELFMAPEDGQYDSNTLRPPVTSAYESLISRFRYTMRIYKGKSSPSLSKALIEASLLRLSWADLDILKEWMKEISAGLIPLSSSELSTLAAVFEAFKKLRSVSDGVMDVLFQDLAVSGKMSADKDLIEAQPVDPLLNPLLRLIPPTQLAYRDPQSVALAQEFLLNCFSMEQQLLISGNGSERSNGTGKAVSSKSPSYSNPDRVFDKSLAFQFLGEINQHVLDWLLTSWTRLDLKLLSATHQYYGKPLNAEQQVKTCVQDIMVHWHGTFDLVSSPTFEQASLQMHIQLWHALIAKHHNSPESFGDVIKKVLAALRRLESSWHLTTGLSMERLWAAFRPTTPTSLQRAETFIQLEQLSSRYDAIIWKTRQSLTEAVARRDSLRRALRSVLYEDVEGGQLVKALSETIDALEDNSKTADSWEAPYFQPEFEGLCQLYDLRHLAELEHHGKSRIALDPLISLLAKRPTSSRALSSSAEFYDHQLHTKEDNSFILFSDLLAFSAHGKDDSIKLLALGPRLPLSIFHKIRNVQEVILGKLDLLHLEALQLARNVVRSAEIISTDQLQSMSAYLLQIVRIIFNSHADLCSDAQRAWAQSTLKCFKSPMETFGLPETVEFFTIPDKSGQDQYFQIIAEEYFIPSVYAIHKFDSTPASLPEYSEAWIRVAVGCLLLYVPDLPFDPALRTSIKNEMHQRRKKVLLEKLDALFEVEKCLSGQTTNPRCEILAEELQTLINEPSILSVVRPVLSELGRLQVEHNNLLASLIAPLQDSRFIKELFSSQTSSCQGIDTLLSNSLKISQRVSMDYRLYDDITAPLVGMLGCLNIGLSLLTLLKVPSEQAAKLEDICAVTPFLGARPEFLFGKFLRDSKHASINSMDYRMSYLEWVAILNRAEGLSCLDQQGRRRLTMVFHEVYKDWKRQLEIDRECDTENSRLYRYRGHGEMADEVDQKELEELFPSYDDSGSSGRNMNRNDDSPQKLVSNMAEIHSDIFNGCQVGERILQSIEKAAIEHLGGLNVYNIPFASLGMTENFMVGLVLSLHRMTQRLSETTMTAGQYSFYKDSNLTESHKAVDLVCRIRSRFQDIKTTWPEHATLQDVLNTCMELLEFKHVDPVAKLLTKGEKLHNYMHEWETVASKEFSAGNLFAELTSLLISWRRLELSTWARLFREEEEMCGYNARLWWYMAYELVIAVPLSIAESGEDLRQHVVDVLSTLESFLSTTALGQFSKRLQMLRRLEEHLRLIAQDVKPMQLVSEALGNFLNFYSLFEPGIQSTLTEGRLSLEKEAKEIVLLASWKDTNIIALRESARRSHFKLFKLVRRYRALLGQSAADHLIRGLETTPKSDVSNHSQPFTRRIPEWDENAIRCCQMSIIEWSLKPKRLTDISSTVLLMNRTIKPPETSSGAIEALVSFSSDLVVSVRELRSQTPGTLSDENQALVKRLRARKQKLFEDTLKAIRQMGVRHNLGTAVLSAQASTAVILAETEPLPSIEGFEVLEINHQFHQMLDLAGKARHAVSGHSDDLSATEITRSMGYLEGLLSLLLRQRGFLASNLRQLSALKSATQMISSLWVPEKYNLCLVTGDQAQRARDLKRTILWLPHILEIASCMLDMHCKLGEVTSHETAEALSAAKLLAEKSAKEWRSLPELPTNITSSLHGSLYETTETFLVDLREQLRKLTREQPSLGYIFKQTLPWAELLESVPTASNGSNVGEVEPPTFSLHTLDDQISKSCDTILIALQKVQSLVQHTFSLTDPRWLANHDEQLMTTIRTLGAAQVTQELETSLEQLSDLSEINVDDLHIASARFAVALPIVKMYSTIYEEALQGYSAFHRSTLNLACILTKLFAQLASNGYCTPTEQSSGKDGTAQSVEDGTGLGEGSGANDMSRDIDDNESLTDIAQEPNTSADKKEMNDEEDAVEMGDDIDGQLDTTSQSEDKDISASEAGSENELDEVADKVEDLDPNAVDEKFWNGEEEPVDKDQNGNKPNGKATEDEQVAKTDIDKPNDQKEDESMQQDGVGAQEDEEVRFEEKETQDPYVKEGDILDLPEDINFDKDEKSAASEDIESDDLGDRSNYEEDDLVTDEIDDQKDDMNDTNMDEASEHNVSEVSRDELMNDRLQMGDVQQENANAEDEAAETEAGEQLTRDLNGLSADVEDAAPTDVQGVGEDQTYNEMSQDLSSYSSVQRNNGAETSGSDADAHQATITDNEQADSKSDLQQQAQRAGDHQPESSPQSQAFRKMGSVLERWHRQREQIRDASERQDSTRDEVYQGMDNPEFEHLQNDSDAADAQALGAATNEQAHALDDSMAIDSADTKPDVSMTDNVPEDVSLHEREEKMDVDDAVVNPDQQVSTEEERRPRAVVGSHDSIEYHTSSDYHEEAQNEEDVEDMDSHLSAVHLSSSAPFIFQSASNAHALWTQLERSTRPHSLILTEQLRLILNPTVATKMRGDFRTGKRLNMKRIIPYVASQYKRDKIWMRRSAPTKRDYQIMLSVDDSKSMGENNAGQLAFETLVMVARSLTMLEVGQICIVAFGEDVRVAHEFESSFSAAAGARIFQHFGFQQGRTDVRALLSRSLDLFRTTRHQTSSSSSTADLWQLQIIISDGLCEDHDAIRRLVRQAQEEHIMIIFIIVDNIGRDKKDGASGGGGSSILEMTQAKFERDPDDSNPALKVRMQRYLDTFPFPFYLVVTDVKHLPAVLANALRQWFREVVDAGAAVMR